MRSGSTPDPGGAVGDESHGTAPSDYLSVPPSRLPTDTSLPRLPPWAPPPRRPPWAPPPDVSGCRISRRAEMRSGSTSDPGGAVDDESHGASSSAYLSGPPPRLPTDTSLSRLPPWAPPLRRPPWAPPPRRPTWAPPPPDVTLNMQPPQSPPPPPPDVSGCRISGRAEMRSGSTSDPGGAVSDESHGAAPSDYLSVPPSRLPTDTSLSRLPPWAPPPRHPPWGRKPTDGRTPSASPPQHPERQPTNLKRSQNFNSDSEPTPEKRTETSCIPIAESSATRPAADNTPTTSAKRRRREPIMSKSRKKVLDDGMGREEAAQEHQLGEGVVREEVEQEEMGSDSESSACSSPLREPQPPLVPIWTSPTGEVYHGLTRDRAALNNYNHAYRKYEEKQARQEKLLTLRPSHSVSSIMECYSPKQKKTFLRVAKSVLKLSAYLDDKEINQCTGLILEWDEVKRSGIILTSAWLICTKKTFDDWSEKEYAPEAKVMVDLFDGSTLEGQLLYFSEHYDIAFYKVSGGSHLQISPLETNLEYEQNLCVLARDKKMDLICKTVQVKYLDPCEYQHNHYLFISDSIPKCGSGGALTDFNGKLVGLLFNTLPLTAFIPSSLILKCSGLLRKFGRLARPQLGFKLRTVGFLDTSHIESLSRNYGVTSGLIVGEVLAESVAERLGIRVGDVILSCQGESLSSVTQWEEILLGIGERHLEKSNDLSLKVDVEVGVFLVRKRTQRVIHLTVELSDGIEVFHSGS